MLLVGWISGCGMVKGLVKGFDEFYDTYIIKFNLLPKGYTSSSEAIHKYPRFMIALL